MKLIDVQRRFADKPGALPCRVHRENMLTGQTVRVIAAEPGGEQELWLSIVDVAADGQHYAGTLLHAYQGGKTYFGPEHILRIAGEPA